jgi:RimJ/RimL family protein N-acetyltransferase
MTLNDTCIYTRRLKLRKVEVGDLAQYLAWSNSREAHGNYLTPESLGEENALELMNSGLLWNQTNRTYFISLREGPDIGTIHFWLRPERRSVAVVAIKIASPAHRGQGYGTEAQKFLVIHLFKRFGVKAIELYTDVENRAQQRCLHKLGFQVVDCQTYDDHQVKRTGYLFRLEHGGFETHPIYRYHYE